MVVNIPSEVIGEILSRVPVKSLLRFRSTIKSWRSLIDSPYFISLHLNRSIQSSSNTNVIFRHVTGLYEVDLDVLDKAYEFDCPLLCHSHRITVIGSQNGLFCVRGDLEEDIWLWNPYTRKHRILPQLSPINPRDNTVFSARVYGFAYDSFSDDYKLLRISYFVGGDDCTLNSKVKI